MRWGKLARSVPVLACALLLAGCSRQAAANGADDVARGGARVLGDLFSEAPVSGVYRPTRLPGVQIPQAQLPQVQATSMTTAEQLRNRHLAPLDRLNAKSVSETACQANTLWELRQAETLDEAIGQAVREHGGDVLLRARIEALTKDLASPRADNSGQGGAAPTLDIFGSTKKITTFVFCEGISREYGA